MTSFGLQHEYFSHPWPTRTAFVLASWKILILLIQVEAALAVLSRDGNTKKDTNKGSRDNNIIQ